MALSEYERGRWVGKQEGEEAVAKLERLEGTEPGREPASFACPQPGCAVKFEGHVGDTPMCSGMPPNQHAGRRMHTVEGTEPLTDDEIRLCLEGLSLRAYRMSPVGLIDSARAKLRARLGADG